MSFILQPWHIVRLALSRNFNDTGADDYLRGTGVKQGICNNYCAVFQGNISLFA